MHDNENVEIDEDYATITIDLPAIRNDEWFKVTRNMHDVIKLTLN